MSTTDHRDAPARSIASAVDPDRLAEGFRPDEHVTVIRPRPGWIAVNWGELYQARELFTTLIVRDLRIRYKQTVLGVAWAVLQPLTTMIVFAFTFGFVLGVKSEGVPYPLFVFAGLVPWTFFSTGVNNASVSLLANQNLLTKIYMPRLYVPASAVGGALVDMCIGMLMFFVLMPMYGRTPGWGLLALPFIVLLAFAATLGVGLILAAATVLYRDLRFVISFGISLLLYLSPVIFRIDQISRPLQFVAALNPMYGVINGFRSSILGDPWDPATLAVSTVMTALLLTFGLFFFRKTERLITDIV
jgi:lipopolysaccharide transport system permease protein